MKQLAEQPRRSGIPMECIKYAKNQDELSYVFGDHTIPAGATATISICLGIEHVPLRLEVSDDVADAFVVNEIAVGDFVKENQLLFGDYWKSRGKSLGIFVNAKNVPDFRKVVVGLEDSVQVIVTNTSDAPQIFVSRMIARPHGNTDWISQVRSDGEK